MKKNVKVAIKRPNEKLEVLEIENTLKAKQSLINGLIEYAFTGLVGDNISMIINEEGKFLHAEEVIGFEENFKVRKANDYIVGNCIFVKLGEEDIEDLTTEDIQKIENFLLEQSKTPKNTFTKWLDTFLEEKELDTNEFITLSSEFKIVNIQMKNIIELIKNLNTRDQQQAKNTLVRLDFLKKDIKDFLIYVAKANYLY